MGGRGGYADEKSYGRFGPRSGGGYQNGINGMSVVAMDIAIFLFELNYTHYLLLLIRKKDLLNIL